ncbi:hypothetical protein PVK06_005208 [Gossypium arboreum]|uniref:DUF7745 domain-containing protein n=1 Tax=Gossypium arboreum TaxID=29729 RepID=A0ABR0QV87_GOSAR|nr:hypothetical protein PVK06_005208 [Gossypium arboreum]
MENGLLDRVEGNADVHRWLEQTQLEKRDSITMGYVSELSDYTRISVTQNNLQELISITMGSVDEHLFRALAQFWNAAYSCFTFGEVDSVPTVEEYTTLLRCPRSLGACRRAGVGRFIGCAQLLLAWFYSHFRLIDGIVCQVFFENNSSLKDIVASSRKVDVLEENWIALLQNLQSKDVEWKAPWMVPVTQGLAESEFVYRGADYKRKVSKVSSSWNKTCRLKGVAINPAMTPKYVKWRSRRINDNVPMTKMEEAQPVEEYLQVIPSELDIIKQEFKRKNLELGKKIEKLEEEKMYLKKENKGLKTKVSELGRSLRWNRNHDPMVELKELKSKVEDLEVALHDGELRIEQLEAQEDCIKGELHQVKDQVRDRDYIIGEAIA